jgi:hypothetical protein
MDKQNSHQNGKAGDGLFIGCIILHSWWLRQHAGHLWPGETGGDCGGFEVYPMHHLTQYQFFEVE